MEIAANFEMACEPDKFFHLTGAFSCRGGKPDKPALVAVEYFDKVGSLIEQAYPDLSASPQVGQYRYLAVSHTDASRIVLNELLEPHQFAVKARMRIAEWTSKLTVATPIELRAVTIDEYLDEVDQSSLSTSMLLRLIDRLTRNGDVVGASQVCKVLADREPRPSILLKYKMLQGTIIETNPTWIPRIFSKQNNSSKDPTKICHLFKVIYPQESSGGSVRNWSVVTSQAEIGLQPIVCMPIQNDPIVDRQAAEYKQVDGLIEVEQEGVTIVYSQFQAFKRQRIPADRLLELETNLHFATLESRGVAIIHAASGFRGYENALKGLALAKHFDVPFVYEVRSFHEHTWAEAHPRVLEANLTKRRSAQEERCMGEADAVVTISEAMVDELTRRGISRNKIHLVPNAVDSKFLQPANREIIRKLREEFGLGEGPVVGYISNLSKREGHEVLLRAFSNLENCKTYRCLIVGNGKEAAALRVMAAELGITERVIFTGEIDHALIRDVYCLIDVFVVPRIEDYASDYVTPMKPFEALAIGASLIMSDRPVAREIIGNDERGILFRTGDYRDLATKIQWVLDHRDQMKVMAANGKRWVCENRTWKRNAETYRAIYDDVLGERSSRPYQNSLQISKRDQT